MNAKERTKIIKQAEKKASLLKDDKYIEAQITRDGLKDLTLQMGPNCNLSCFHCYGNYGPTRKGLPKPKIIKKCLEEAVDIGLKRVCLTDGEPFRYQNRGVIGLVAQFSKHLPVNIITNGSFARTKNNASSWFNFLKENGFDLGQKGNNLEVSCGIMYNVNPNNYFRINNALREVFPDADFGAHFSYRGVFVPDKLECDYENIKKIVSILESSFRVRKSSSMKKDRKGNLSFFVYPTKGSSVKIKFVMCRPAGKAKSLKGFDKYFPNRLLDIKNLGFSPDLSEGLWVRYDGNVSFGHSGQCIKEGKFYGNVADDYLKNIKRKIQNDSIYQAFKLGGARFMYHLTQKTNSNFKIIGRTRCDVCNAFFRDINLVSAVREMLNKEGVAESYKEFVNKLDFRKKVFL